ncbi:hypothetical protein AAFC00_000731 [Neodothiora populina]|uniref:tripeptidyl-peptidase II n=1 Tax=Neodothiora populina TaxID=2781224 RepID=A0ABR3PF17_9PEZI
MRTTGILLAAGLLAGSVNGKPIRARSPYTVKESHLLPSRWREVAPAPASHTINLRIALKQDRFHELERHLYEVSDPSHDRYGQHLTEHEVKKFVQPADQTLELVREWLADNGINDDHLSFSPAKDWITIPLPVERVESLLDTKYSLYRHDDGSETVRTLNWSLPSHLHEHIDTIQPTNSFFRAKPQAISLQVEKRPDLDSKALQYYEAPDVGSVCVANAVTPGCLRTLYGTIDYEPQSAGVNKMGLTDYLDESNNRSDTYLYLQRFRPEAKEAAYEFTFDVIDNGSTAQSYPPGYVEENEPDIEANLDVETMIGIGWPTPLIAYTTGGSPPFTADDTTTSNTNEPYLEWLSYVLATNDSDLAKVISTSYDDDEQTVPLSYAVRTCNEFAQLGARGVSLFFAAGDGGVGGAGSCYSNNGTNAPTFLPLFPSTCPYITSVGGTMNFNPEVVAHSGSYAGGGGFSDYFARPSYQDSVVTSYVEGLNGKYAGLYNASGRAYPDLAAQGLDYVIYWDGQSILVSGTSAATPTIASVFALVNDALVTAGKSTMGFLNPWLYQTGHTAFTDITSGSARGCGDISDGLGFPAKKSWDAVTGWGTPNFKDILSVLGVDGTFDSTKGAYSFAKDD